MTPANRNPGIDQTDARIAIAAPGKMPYALLLGLLSIAPMAVVIGSLTGVSSDVSPDRLLPVLGIVLMIEAPIAALLIWAAGRRRVDIVSGHLEVRAAFYRKRVALDDLELDRARIVDIREKRELGPRIRTNGFGLPGFAAGHFRAAGGRKMFCLMTRPRNLWLPVSDGTSLLLSAENPTDALNRLRRLAGPDRREASEPNG